MPEKESAARPPPHSKNPQDYLKPILAKEPDRVKGIRAGERVRTLEDIHPSRCEGHLACLCAPVGIGFCVAACSRLAGLRGFVPHILRLGVDSEERFFGALRMTLGRWLKWEIRKWQRQRPSP